MKITCPFFSQKALDEAIETINVCYQKKPVHGLIHPYYAPGGMYGADWWSLDYTLIIDGVKWLDFSKVREYVENLYSAQMADGRIPLYGCEDFSHFENVKENISSLPKRLGTLAKIYGMTEDASVKKMCAEIAEKDIIWWLNNRKDKKTGLISAVFEETFIPNTETGSMEYAPMDTNTEIMLGCEKLAEIFKKTDNTEKALKYRREAEEIKNAIEKYLWNEEKNGYFAYRLKEEKQDEKQMASMFLGFYLCDGERKEKLKNTLTDKEQFLWGTRPITSVSKKDKLFQVVEGDYTGNPAWSGSVWTLINQQTINALLSSGYFDEATELAYMTITEFAHNYTEFIQPLTGTGEGVLQYGWTAAQIIQILIENIFGIDYSAKNGLLVKPNIPEEFKDELFSVSDLILPNGKIAQITILSGEIKITVK